jgi:hypothetical protein
MESTTMAREVHLPDEPARKAFIEKLGKFRQGLEPSEREMLDIMAITTFSPHTRDEVHGYTWFWSAGGPTGPGWYNNGWSYGWDNTAYQNTAYSVYASPDGKYLP